MFPIFETALVRLEQEERLENATFKATTPAERFGFRGDLVLRFQPGRGPRRKAEVRCQDAFAVAKHGSPTIPFFAGRLGA
ncbi:MAG TPA: hypothetical protein VIM73_15995, partial [Polyangiaceae bacterium]